MKTTNNKKTIIKSNVTRIILSLILLNFFMIPILPETIAGGQDATFDSIKINAVPSMQGVGGNIELEVLANFFGGCCYHLYAFDVKAELVVPENVQIKSSLPEPIKSFDAEPGGMASTINFKWIVSSNSPGAYDVEITVGTSNCGSHTEIYTIIFTEGASISSPTIFPSEPSVKQDVTFSAIIQSGNDNINVEKASLYIWRNVKEYNRNILTAKRNMIFELKDNPDEMGNTSNKNDTNKFLGYGSMYPMNKVDFTDNWRIHLKDIEEEEYLYYWFWVETSDDTNITSEVYKQQILDYEQKSQMISDTIWITLLTVIIGTILILIISWKYIEKTSEKVSKTGIFILGSKTFSQPIDHKRSNVDYTSPEKVKLIILIILVVMMVLFLILAVYLGLFQDLINETGG
jgi:hypothetical protein